MRRPDGGARRCRLFGKSSRAWCVGLGLAAIATALGAEPAQAQSITLDLNEGTGITERALQLVALITVLSLAPSVLVMVTSFTRIVVVLSLLRTALGVQQSPPNSVLISLALFLTAFIMAPVFQSAYKAGIEPLMQEQISLPDAFERASRPFHAFMSSQVREKDLKLFIDMSNQTIGQNPDTAAEITSEEVPLHVLVPAFVISELKRAFEIGFLLFVPFIVIDMVVASVLMSMGMMMLPPIVVSLPFKLIFFVLVDGWHLVTGSLVQSFIGSG
ncbi:Flagellar biosynthesis protein FliP [hydrothermal vent metagenome]|uniref:Flagellar biosynthetic protein FliP n=1 Tax=hydrothermal vent metagenome TaxID=652676 RepID=A0A3B0TRV2_9ZZZZ